MSRLFPTPPWAAGAVLYEVNLRQYTLEGTFKGFQAHLPRLKEMGVRILWLMPVTPISSLKRQGTLGSYYAAASYDRINPEFGSMKDFAGLIDAAHALNMYVIIDWVANHTGCDHEWTSEHPDWYIKDEAGDFTERNGWQDVIDLDFTKQEMRVAMIRSMQGWVEMGVDGFRCDMAHLVPLDFWQQARSKCDQQRPLFWLGECEVAQYQDVFDVTYGWAWMHAGEQLVKGKISITEMYGILNGYEREQQALSLLFTSNHDENSWNGTEYEKFGGAARAMAVLTCTWKGMPLVYSGQESPNTKRLLFFDRDTIAWNNPPQLHEFYRRLLHLHERAAIAAGETFILPATHEMTMAFFRKKENETVLVILNFSSRDQLQLTISHPWLQGNFENLFSGLQHRFQSEEIFEVHGYAYIVYVKQG